MSHESGFGEILKIGLIAVAGYLVYEELKAYGYFGTSAVSPTTAATATPASAGAGASVATSTPVSESINLDIDTPSANSQLSGGFVAGGWVADNTNSTSQVVIQIDGATVATSGLNTARADACAQNPNAVGCPNIGWSVALDSTKYSNGPHTMTVTVVSTSGKQISKSVGFSINNPSPVASIPAPSPAPVVTLPPPQTYTPPANDVINIDIDNPAQSGSTTVSGTWNVFGGWITDNAAQVNQVQISVDGQVIGNASRNARNDVCAQHQSVGCPNVGWSYGFNSTQFANGTHTLTVTAISTTGATASKSTTFRINNGAGDLKLADLMSRQLPYMQWQN